MKIHALLIILTSLATASVGCSKHTSATYPKSNDLGVIEVSDGKPSSHTLADGRVCTITPTALPDGNISLATKIIETNASGVRESRTLALEAPGWVSDRAFIYSLDKDTIITVRLHISK